MANEITTSAWSGVLPTLVRRRWIEFASRNQIIAPLCVAETLGQGMGKAVKIAQSADAANVGSYTYKPAEGTDLANAPLTPTTVTLTAAMVGIGFEVSRLAAQASPNASPDYFFEQGAGAISQKLEDDLAALFVALNGGTVIGTSGADLTFAQFLDALVTIQQNQAVGQIAGVLAPIQVADLVRSFGGLAGGGGFAGTRAGASIDGLAAAAVNIAGVNIFTSPRCPAVNANADRSGALFTPDALGIVWAWKADVSKVDQPYLPGIQMSVTAAYGVGETADLFGVGITTDL